LPTLSKLHRSKPEIYITDICPFCKEEKETNIHALTCKELPQEYSIDKIIKDTKQLLIKKLIKKKEKKSKMPETYNKIQTSIDQEAALNLSTTSINTNTEEINFEDMMKGYTPKSLADTIDNIIGSEKHTKTIIREIQKFIREKMEEIWHYRIKKNTRLGKNTRYNQQTKNYLNQEKQ
jgi:hypothetical protein